MYEGAVENSSRGRLDEITTVTEGWPKRGLKKENGTHAQCMGCDRIKPGVRRDE